MKGMKDLQLYSKQETYKASQPATPIHVVRRTLLDWVKWPERESG